MLSTLRSVLAVAADPSADALVAFAQEHRASIRGVVIDPALHGNPNVQVRVSREDTAESRNVRTDEGGLIQRAGAAGGRLPGQRRAAGLRPVRRAAELAMNQEFWLQVPLQIGAVLQAVEVTAPFIPVDRDTPAVAHVHRRAARSPSCRSTAATSSSWRCWRPGTVPPPQGSASSGAATSPSRSTARARTSTGSCSTGSTTSIRS